MATKIVNRQPFSIDYDLDDINQGIFVISEFKGICDNKNDVTIDQSTFSDANNIYVDTNNVLQSRSPIKFNDNTGHIVNQWYFGEYGIRLVEIFETTEDVEHHTYYLYCFTHECYFNETDKKYNYIILTRPIDTDNKRDDKVIKITPVWIEDKVFFWIAGMGIYVFNLAGELITSDDYNTRLPYFEDGVKYLYIPITKLMTNGLESELESENFLTSAYRRRYLYSAESPLPSNIEEGKPVVVQRTNTDGAIEKLYTIKADENLKYKLVYPHSSVGDTDTYKFKAKIKNNILILLRINLSDKSLEVSYDGYIFYPVPYTGAYMDDRLVDITDDGQYLVCAFAEGIGFCKLFANTSDDTQIGFVDNYTWELLSYDDLLLSYVPRDTKIFGLKAHSRDEWCAYCSAYLTSGMGARVEHYIIGEYLNGDTREPFSNWDSNYEFITSGTDRSQIGSFDFLILNKSDRFHIDRIDVNFDQGGLVFVRNYLKKVSIGYIQFSNMSEENTHRLARLLKGDTFNNWFESTIDITINNFIKIALTKNYAASGQYDTFDGVTDILVSASNQDNDYLSLHRTQITGYTKDGAAVYNISVSDTEAWNFSTSNNANLSEYVVCDTSKSSMLTESNVVRNIPIFFSTEVISGSTASFDSTKDVISLPEADRVPVAISNTDYYYIVGDMLWTNVIDANNILSLDVYENVTYEQDSLEDFSIQINSNVPDNYTQLGDYYLSFVDFTDGQNKLLVTDTRRDEETDDFLLYLPISSEQRFTQRINNIHPLADNMMGIFCDDAIWYIQALNLDNETVTRYTKAIRSKLPVGNRKNDEILTADNGQAILFPTPRGIAYLSPEDFVATTDRSIKYITDAIQNFYNDFYFDDVENAYAKNKGYDIKSMIKMTTYSYWILFYKYLDSTILLLDTRSNTWWKWSVQYPIMQINGKDNLTLLLLMDKADESYHGVSFLYCDKSYNTYEDDIIVNVYIGDYLVETTAYGERVIYQYADSDIDWSLTSQKLHFGAINNYKRISSVNINANGEGAIVTNYETKAFRDYYHPEDSTTVAIKINDLRTFVQRCNIMHVVNFQFGLSNYTDIDDVEPLSLNSISIKYEVKGVVR